MTDTQIPTDRGPNRVIVFPFHRRADFLARTAVAVRATDDEAIRARRLQAAANVIRAELTVIGLDAEAREEHVRRFETAVRREVDRQAVIEALFADHVAER